MPICSSALRAHETPSGGLLLWGLGWCTSQVLPPETSFILTLADLLFPLWFGHSWPFPLLFPFNPWVRKEVEVFCWGFCAASTWPSADSIPREKWNTGEVSPLLPLACTVIISGQVLIVTFSFVLIDHLTPDCLTVKCLPNFRHYLSDRGTCFLSLPIVKCTILFSQYSDFMIILLKIQIFFEVKRIIKKGGTLGIMINGVRFRGIYLEELECFKHIDKNT